MEPSSSRWGKESSPGWATDFSGRRAPCRRGFSARGLASLPGRRVVVGDAGRIAHSPDGVQWREIPAKATNDLTHVIAANGAFAVAGTGGWLATSEDGLHWRTRILDPSSDLGAPHFVQGRFEWMADSSRVWFSGNLHHPHLSRTRANTVAGWRVTARSRTGQSYRLEVNESVDGDWTEWQNFTLEGAARDFEDLASPPRRFYRLREP